MTISPFAEQLLRLHAQRPNVLFYGLDVLGGIFRDKEVELLDKTYEELAKAGLMEQSRSLVSYFGTPKTLYRLTEAGMNYVTKAPAA